MKTMTSMIFTIISSTLMTACIPSPSPPRAPLVIDASVEAPSRWKLVWRDEFNAMQGAPIDLTKWRHEVGGDGWGNQQLEYNSDRVEEWNADKVRWFVDDHLFFEVKSRDRPKGSPWPYDGPFFLILNLAVGGHFVGLPNELTRFPNSLFVDYVRVYRQEEMR